MAKATPAVWVPITPPPVLSTEKWSSGAGFTVKSLLWPVLPEAVATMWFRSEERRVGTDCGSRRGWVKLPRGGGARGSEQVDVSMSVPSEAVVQASSLLFYWS